MPSSTMAMPLSASMKTFSQSAVFCDRIVFSCSISFLCRASASSAFFGSPVMAELSPLISAILSLSFVPQAAKDSTSRAASSSAVNFLNFILIPPY